MIIECDTCHHRLQLPGDTVPDEQLTPCQNCGENSWTICETSKLMMCNDCGNLISKRAKFCPHCGWTHGGGIPAKVVRFDPQFQDYVKLIIYFNLAILAIIIFLGILWMIIMQYHVK